MRNRRQNTAPIGNEAWAAKGLNVTLEIAHTNFTDSSTHTFSGRLWTKHLAKPPSYNQVLNVQLILYVIRWFKEQCFFVVFIPEQLVYIS